MLRRASNDCGKRGAGKGILTVRPVLGNMKLNQVIAKGNSRLPMQDQCAPSETMKKKIARLEEWGVS